MNKLIVACFALLLISLSTFAIEWSTAVKIDAITLSSNTNSSGHGMTLVVWILAPDKPWGYPNFIYNTDEAGNTLAELKSLQASLIAAKLNGSSIVIGRDQTSWPANRLLGVELR